MGAVEPKFWERFRMLIGRPDLSYRSLDPSAVAEVEKEISKATCTELLNRATEFEVPLSPVVALGEVAKGVDLGRLISALYGGVYLLKKG